MELEYPYPLTHEFLIEFCKVYHELRCSSLNAFYTLTRESPKGYECPYALRAEHMMIKDGSLNNMIEQMRSLINEYDTIKHEEILK